MLVVCAGKTAELLYAGVRVTAGVKAVSAGMVLISLLPSGTPAIRRAISTVT